MLKKDISITPAFDYILNDKKKAEYGRGCAKITFAIIGEKGAVTITGFTNWFLPETLKVIPEITKIENNLYSEIAQIHSNIPLKNTDANLSFINCYDNCFYVKSEKCYCYNFLSCHKEEELIKLVVKEGSEALFKKLEYYYKMYLNN